MTCKSQNTVVAPAKGETVKYQGATSQDPLSKALANFLGLGLGAVFPDRRSPGRAGDGDGGQEENSPRERLRGWRAWAWAGQGKLGSSPGATSVLFDLTSLNVRFLRMKTGEILDQSQSYGCQGDAWENSFSHHDL